jgi:hypothetical protein
VTKLNVITVEKRNEYRLLVGKPVRKKVMGRPRGRCVDNIKMEVEDIGWGWCGLDLPGSEYGQVKNCCECGNELSGSINC